MKNNLNLGDTQFRLLGITFSTGIKDTEDLNIKPILKIITSEIYIGGRGEGGLVF